MFPECSFPPLQTENTRLEAELLAERGKREKRDETAAVLCARCSNPTPGSSGPASSTLENGGARGSTVEKGRVNGEKPQPSTLNLKP
jgi:hypothetical protein